MVEHIHAPLPVPVDDDLGIAVRAKFAALLREFPAELGKIVNLAIEDNPDFSRCIRHGLVSRDEVNDRKSPESKTNGFTEVITLVIGTAMADGFCHPSDHRLFDRLRILEMMDAADSAHAIIIIGYADRNGNSKT